MSIRNHINRTVGLVTAGVVGGAIGVGFAAHAAFAPIQTQQVSDTSTPTTTITQTVEPSPTSTSPTTTVAPKVATVDTTPSTTTTTQEPTVTQQPDPQPAETTTQAPTTQAPAPAPAPAAAIPPPNFDPATDLGNAPQGQQGPGAPGWTPHPAPSPTN